MIKGKFLKVLFLLFLISIIPRIFVVSIIASSNDRGLSSLMAEDAMRYYETALHLINAPVNFKNNLGFNILYDAPLYPLFLSIFFKIFGASYQLAIFLNIFLFSISVCLIYIIGKLLFPEKYAFCAAIIFSFYPSLLMYSIYPMSEPLFLVLFLSAFINLILFLKTQKISYLIFTAFLLVLATLTKEVALFIPVIIAIFIIMKNIKKWRTTVKAASLLIAIYIATLSPFLIYNHRSCGYYTLSGKILDYKSALDKKIRVFTAQKRITAINKRDVLPQNITNLFSNSRLYFQQYGNFFAGAGIIGMLRALGYNVSEVEAATKSPRLFINALKKFGWGWAALQYYAWIFMVCVYICSFSALFFLIAKGKITEAAFFLIIFCYFLFVYFYSYSTRYSIPLIPFLSILCSYFLLNIGAMKSKKTTSGDAV